jgi:protocatechuate 3,4-dioxygenase beta subunit
MRRILSGSLALAVALAVPPPDKAPPPSPRPSPAATKPSPKPTPSPVLTGSVRGPDGKPVEGALVRYRPLAASYRELTATTRTDAEGRFRAELKMAGAAYVRVTAKGLAGRSFEKVQPGTPLEVVLDRGRIIEGSVRDAAGQPLAQVRVVAVPATGMAVSAWETDKESIEARTDARGHFQLDGVGSGLYSLSATAHGFGSARKGNVRPGATVNLIARPGGWLAGQVSDPQGRPLKGALVRAEVEPQLWGGSAVETTDAEGRFELPGLDPGSYTVVARHADFAPGVVSGVAVDAEGRADLTIPLAVGAAVTGRLVDSEERPLAGRVAAQELAGQPLPRSLVELLRTDTGPDGRFRIERVPPGSYALGAVAPRFSGRRVEAEVSGREAVIDLGDIALEQGLAIRGRVRTSSGTPVPDADIRTGGFDMMRGGTFSETRSEPDGSFVLAGLLPGPTRVNVRAIGYASINNKMMMPGADPVDVILTAGGAVGGVVVEEGDRPIDAYRVVANPVKSTGVWDGRAEKSVGSSDGRFLLEDLAEETYVLQVLVPDRAPATVSGVRVSAGRTTDAGVIRVPRGGIVRGTVADTSGDPIVGASVKAYGAAQDAMEWSEQMQTLSEPSGAFEIRGVPEGKRQVVATHPDYAAADAIVDVVAAKGPVEARLVLTQGGRIEGLARKRDGTPLAGLTLSVYSQSRPRSGGGRPNTVTRADGGFTIEHVAPGPTMVNLMASVGPGRMMSMMSKQVDVREGETTSVDFSSREILVSGHVTKSGTPVPGVRLQFFGQGGMSFSMAAGFDNVASAPTGPQRHVGITGEDGTFTLIVDTPGKYWVRTESQDGRTNYPQREVQVPDVEAHTLEIAFSGVPVTGIVVDKDTDQPVALASVSAAPKDKDAPRAGSAQTGADGRFQLDADPGDYTLSARAEGYGVAKIDATVAASGLSDARFELEKGLEIKGRVLDASGQGVSGVAVAARAGESEFGGTQTLPDGSFRIAGLAAKPYNLCAGTDLAGYAVRMGASPGGADITLTLRPASRVRLLVKGPDGAPLPNAWASVTKLGSAAISVPFMGRGSTDSTGVTEIPTPAGALEIDVRAEKYKGTAKVSVGEGATAVSEVTLTEPVEKPK